MSLFFFTEPFAELDLLDGLEQRAQRIASATSFLNPELIRNTANLARQHPTLPAAFINAALFMNVGDWPSVQDIATRSAVENDRPNYDYRTAARDSKLTKKRLEVNPETYATRENPIAGPGSLTDLAWKGAKGVVRTAFTLFDSAFDEFANAPVRQGVQDYQSRTESGMNPLLAGAASFGEAAESFDPLTGLQSRVGDQQQGRSPIGQYIKSYTEGNAPSRLNLGSGFLPGADPREEGMSEEQYISKYGLPVTELSHQKREELQIGHRFGGSTAVSPGRVIFNNIVEPGTAPHNLLSGLTDVAWNLAADPTILAGKPISALRKAGKKFAADRGVIEGGARLTIDGVNARSWINSSEGNLVSNILANRSSISEIKDLLPDVKDRKLLNALRTASNPQQVKELLLPTLGVEVSRVPYSGGVMRRAAGTITAGEIVSHLPLKNADMARIAGFAPYVTRQFQSTRFGRWFVRRPGLHISSNNLDQAFTDVDQWMKSVGGFTDELREKHLRNWAGIQDGNGTQLYTAAKELMDDSMARQMDILDESTGLTGKLLGAEKAKTKQASKSIIRGVHELFESQRDSAMYFVNEVGETSWFPGSKLHDPSGFGMPTPHTISEHLTQNISLPDPSDIRRVTNRLHKYGKVKDIKPDLLTRVARQSIMKVWTTTALMAAQWPLKVLADEQVRMWVGGLRSSFNDPLQFLAAITFGKIDPGNRMKAFDIMGNDLRKLASSDIGETNKIVNEYRSAMARGHNGYLGPVSNTAGMTRGFRKKYAPGEMHPGSPDYFDDWAGVELSTLANDEIVPRIAREGPESVKRWFWFSDEGRGYREKFARSLPEGGERILDDRSFADNFIDSYNARIHMKTGGQVDVIPGDGYVVRQPGHSDLVNIIAKGTYKGSNGEVFSLRPGDKNFNPEGLGSVLQSNYSDYAPPVIKGVAPSKINRADDPGIWERGTNLFFDVAMSKPSNFLSRSPSFDQNFWNKVDNLVPYLDDADRAKLAKTAGRVKRKVNFDQPRADRTLTLSEVEEVAGAHASQAVKDLLYDNSRRLNWTEASRHVFPFAEAWVEINRTWGRLLAENPEKIRRLQQGLTAARSEGFISVDEESGEQYFNIPGAGMLQDMFGIEDSPLQNLFTGSIDAWNPLQGGYFPGIGPMVQIPLSYMLPQESDYDWLREMLLPFGVEKIEEPNDLIGVVMPQAWHQVGEAMLFDEKDGRQLGMVGDIFNQLILSGEYDLSNPEEQTAALERSRRIAKHYDLIRAVGGFFLPGTPRFRQRAEDKKGQWLFVEAIADQYFKVKQKDGEETADDWLLENFALTADQVISGQTLEVRKRPLTESGWAFQRDHPEVFDALPNTGYYLYPDNPDEAFSYESWANQLEEGDRALLTPQQKQFSREQQEAYEFRNEALTILLEAGVTPQSEKGRDLMRMVDEYLKSEYPTWGQSNVGVPERADIPHMLDELRGWQDLEGPVTNSRTWQNVNEFMTLMDGLQEIATDVYGFSTLDSTTDPNIITMRQTLYEFGEELAADDPGFNAMWQDFLMNAVLTRQDQSGMEDDEPFDQLSRRLNGQNGMFPDTTEEATILGQ